MNNTLSARYSFYPALLLLLLAASAILINFFIYHYPGNNYFPPNSLHIAICLMLMQLGFTIQFGKSSLPAKLLKELLFFFLIMCVLALATNAAQYTPFPPIDKQILAFERVLHINMGTIISWLSAKPLFKAILAFIYDTLPFQMTYIPLLIIASKRLNYIREYYFLLLVSAIIGFSFYYFFPTTAPASVIASNQFSASQHATGLKFIEIHQYIPPTTNDGGMIALPSFHAIWAWFCLYLLRDWPIAFGILLPINVLLITSCVLLGWHYPEDIVGALIVILLSHGLYYLTRRLNFTG
jgi:hypothetical protein